MSGVARPPLLIVAATATELEPLLEALDPPRRVPAGPWPAGRAGDLEGRPAVVAEAGVGTAAAAAAIGVLAERHAPSACLLVGIAGAYLREAGTVPLGAAACASEEVLLDAGVVRATGTASFAEVPLPLVPGDPPLFERVPTDPAWTAALAEACGRPPLPFATSDGVAGDAEVAAARAAASGAAIESMEGAAAALACRRLGLPFAEVRGVSNVAGERDKAAWRIADAVAASCDALRRAIALHAGGSGGEGGGVLR